MAAAGIAIIKPSTILADATGIEPDFKILGYKFRKFFQMNEGGGRRIILVNQKVYWRKRRKARFAFAKMKYLLRKRHKGDMGDANSPNSERGSTNGSLLISKMTLNKQGM